MKKKKESVQRGDIAQRAQILIICMRGTKKKEK